MRTSVDIASYNPTADVIVDELVKTGQLHAQVDQVIVTVPIKVGFNVRFNDAFCPRNVPGHSRFEKRAITPMHNHWDCYRYTNLETGNPIDVHINKYFITMRFHSEGCVLTHAETESFTNNIFNQYVDFINGIKPDSIFFSKTAVTVQEMKERAYVSHVEVAVDFMNTQETYFIHNELHEHLHKKRTRNRNTYGGTHDSGMIYRSGHQMFNGHKTHYIGGKRSGSQVKFYVKAKLRDMSPYNFVRMELKLKRDYLKRKGVTSLDDLLIFDFAQYWEGNFMFFTLDWKKIMKYANRHNHFAGNLMVIKHCFSEHAAYEIVKKLLNNPTSLLKPKWEHLSRKIMDALREVSITFRTSNKQSQGAYKTHEILTNGTMRKILAAREDFRKDGITPSIRKMAKRASVSQQSAFKYRKLYLE